MQCSEVQKEQKGILILGATGWVYYTPYREDLVQAFHGPQTIEETLAQCNPDGTGTILDLTSAEPFTKEQLLHLFGTEKPTKHLAETLVKTLAILDGIFRESGYHAILHNNGIPTGILFARVSGD